MRRFSAILSLLAGVLIFAGTPPASAQDVRKPAEPTKIEDILSAQQLDVIARRRAEAPIPAGPSYRFTFDDVPGYGHVEVYYLVRETAEGGRVVRRLADYPSAVVYLVEAVRYSEVRNHLNEAEFADVLEQMLAVEKSGGVVRSVSVRRGLFDIGDAPSADFLKSRKDYYESAMGKPLFDKWPEAFRKPAGKFGPTVVHTSVWRAPDKSAETKTIYAKQFFGYQFPVLDDVLTPDQKKSCAETLKSTNIRDGAAPVKLAGVRDFGDVTLYYLVKDGVPLARPTAMVARVTLTVKEIAADPLVLRKHLAPEGANYLVEQIRAGEKAGQKLKAVEITRVLVDVADKARPDYDAVHAEFKKDITRYCAPDSLIAPDTWPERFRRPDGQFDVELTSTRVIWLIEKRQ